MKICKHFFISGRVQGVFYRDSTKTKARELGVTGWVRNVQDGRVEAVVCGDDSQIDLLAEWLWQGPPAAKVEKIESEQIEWEEHQEFKTRS